MLLDNVKPLMIVWLPVKASTGFDFGLLSTKIGNSFIDNAVDFVVRRTSADDVKVAEIPIPFYFYERLSDDKSNEDSMTGFLLDSCSENIDLAYPDTPTTQSDTTAGAIGSIASALTSKAQETFVIKNTIDVSFRVKMGSTPVSVFRALMKRVLTNPEITKDLRFSWFWREYVLSYAKCIDYNEEPITGTDMVMIKLRFQHASDTSLLKDQGSATVGGFPVSTEMFTRVA